MIRTRYNALFRNLTARLWHVISKGKVVPILNQVPSHEDIREWRYSSMHFGTRRRWVVSSSRPFYHWEVLPTLIGEEAGWILESFWTRWRREKKSFLCPGRAACSLVIILTDW